MKTLFELCKPRASVFNGNNREDVLDLENLADGSINAEHFFNETYITDGMKTLFHTAFNRFNGSSQTGLLRLTQSMGGGKTHAMLSLGLLAKNPKLRKKVLYDLFGDEFENVPQDITVVSYTGRNSDIEYGIWGEIASQLGKLDGAFYKNYCEQLKAPGQATWTNLLKDKPILILLDELPPYLEYTKTIPVGKGTLADTTTNALSNLFNALGKAELSNVCVVVSDLTASYEFGGKLIGKVFKDLNKEIGRTATNIEPVTANSDDLFMILRKRLFEELPSDEEINIIASAYKDAVNKQRQVGHTTYNADSIYLGVKDTYPFHYSIKDLFARFKENVNFQQTRGIIRLARQMVRGLYELSNNDCLAKHQYLINAYDIDLNNKEMISMIRDIKPSLSNAISHDICGAGKSVAEELSRENSIVLDISKLILMSSLGDVVGAIQGLNESEIIGILSCPNRDLTNIKKIIEEYKSKAWYLYMDRDAKYFFKDIKNVNAELRSIVESYTIDTAKKEIKAILQEKFLPKIKDCYQEVLVFPSIDDIEGHVEKNTLILFEPGDFNADLETFYKNTTMKNRFMFLSGSKDTMDSILSTVKEVKAISSIIRKLKEEHVPETDSQYILALDIEDKTRLKLLSTLRETFVKLYYPTSNGLDFEEITMNFIDNNFVAENQIRETLKEVYKFVVDTTSDDFKDMLEDILFTSTPMKWRDILQRAAETTDWIWYKPSAINEAKNTYISKEFWTEENGMVDKNPPLPLTSVSVQNEYKNAETGEVYLKLKHLNGDTIHYETNGEATISSNIVANGSEFKTKELKISFLCSDSEGKHDLGSPYNWKNNLVEVKYRIYTENGSKMCELDVDNDNLSILYTIDGTSPRVNGLLYAGPFIVDSSVRKLLAIAVDKNEEQYGKSLEVSIQSTPVGGGINCTDNVVNICKDKKLKLTKRIQKRNTKETYELLDSLDNNNGAILDIGELSVSKKSDSQNYISISGKSSSGIKASDIKNIIDELIAKGLDGDAVDVTLSTSSIEFASGQHFEDWIAERKEDIENYRNDINQ